MRLIWGSSQIWRASACDTCVLAARIVMYKSDTHAVSMGTRQYSGQPCAGICKTPRMTIAKQHISAASLSGPYWADIDFSPLLAIPHVRPLHSADACCLASAWLLPCLTTQCVTYTVIIII